MTASGTPRARPDATGVATSAGRPHTVLGTTRRRPDGVARRLHPTQLMILVAVPRCGARVVPAVGHRLHRLRHRARRSGAWDATA